MRRKSRASASSIEGGVERGEDVSVASSAGRDAWDAASACAGALIWVEGAAFSIGRFGNAGCRCVQAMVLAEQEGDASEETGGIAARVEVQNGSRGGPPEGSSECAAAPLPSPRHRLQPSIRLTVTTMLAEAISALFTGHYDLIFVPVALPEPLVRALLPSEWGNADDAFLSNDQLAQAAGVAQLPDPGHGKRWVCVEAGKQVDTGVNYVPMGKSTFFVSHCPFSLLQCTVETDPEQQRLPGSQSRSPIPAAPASENVLAADPLHLQNRRALLVPPHVLLLEPHDRTPVPPRRLYPHRVFVRGDGLARDQERRGSGRTGGDEVDGRVGAQGPRRVVGRRKHRTRRLKGAPQSRRGYRERRAFLPLLG